MEQKTVPGCLKYRENFSVFFFYLFGVLRPVDYAEPSQGGEKNKTKKPKRQRQDKDKTATR